MPIFRSRPKKADTAKRGVASTAPTRLLERNDVGDEGEEIASAPRREARSITSEWGTTSPTKASAHDVLLQPVVGWLAIIEGPGRGHVLGLHPGINALGRSSKAQVRIDYGDSDITPEDHAIVNYDLHQNQYYAFPGQEGAPLLINGKLVTGPMALRYGDHLVMGVTTLRFIPLCGPDFHWHAET